MQLEDQIGRMQIAEPLDRAISHMRSLLFSPPSFGVWLSFGVIIFIEVLFGQGVPTAPLGLTNFNLPRFTGGFEEYINTARDWTGDHWSAVVGIGMVGGLAWLLWLVVSTWISSRGQLMLVHAVATSDTRIGEGWRSSGERSQSLFVIRLVLRLTAFVIHIVFGASAILVGVALYKGGGAEFATFFWPLFSIGSIWAILICTLALIGSLQRQFVVPIMFHRHLSAVDAWRVFGPIARRNIWPLHLYYFVLLIYALVYNFASILTGCLTCFLGVLPVVHHTLLAPLFLFERSFGLCVLESLGPEFAIIQLAPTDFDPYGENLPRDLR